ncbi:MAG: hypothetical protein WBZ29_03815 [Methanocella sp.]
MLLSLWSHPPNGQSPSSAAGQTLAYAGDRGKDTRSDIPDKSTLTIVGMQ